MPDKVDIFNVALIACGQEPISDINEKGEGPRLCRGRYDAIRDATLRAHPWNFALERASLAAEQTAPAWGYDRQFALPTNPFCLRVWQAFDTTYKFKVEGRKLLTNEASPFKILYIARRTDEAVYDPIFVEACGLRLARAIVVKLTGKVSRREAIDKEYKDVLGEGRSIDAQEGTPDDVEADELLDARL